MNQLDLKKLEVIDLLHLFSDVINELKERKVIRTRNNPVADYAEWLVTNQLNLKLESNSNSGYDAISEDGIRYQIKSRRLDPDNDSTQLGVIRNLNNNEFDYLITVIFNKDFSVREAYQIPHNIIAKYARFSEHQNGHILIVQGELLKDVSVLDITSKLI